MKLQFAPLTNSTIREQLAAFGPGITRHFADQDIHALRRAAQCFDGDLGGFANEGTLLFQRAARVHFQVQGRNGKFSSKQRLGMGC